MKRGATSEHRIKELKLGIKADRLSCQSFRVNQFRLFLSKAAYILMLSLRKAAEGTKLATASVTRLRERIIKSEIFAADARLIFDWVLSNFNQNKI